MTTRVRRKRKGTWNYKRLFVFLLTVGLLLSILGGGIAWATIFEPAPPLADIPRGEEVPGKTHILIAGIDNYWAMTGRSDTMIVLSIDNESGDMVMISIPRDSRYDIPGHGYDKLNQAMMEGGIPLLRACIEELLGIRIDHYVFTNLAGFEDIVDAVGGIQIQVEKEMRIRTTKPTRWVELEPGSYRMDGLLAMAYVRFRSDEEGDFGRMRRQREFLVALSKKMLSVWNAYRLPLLVHALTGAVRTDIPLTEGLRLAMDFRDLNIEQLQTVHLPGTCKVMDGKAFVLLDMEEKDRIVDEIIWEKTTQE